MDDVEDGGTPLDSDRFAPFKRYEHDENSNIYIVELIVNDGNSISYSFP